MKKLLTIILFKVLFILALIILSQYITAYYLPYKLGFDFFLFNNVFIYGIAFILYKYAFRIRKFAKADFILLISAILFVTVTAIIADSEHRGYPEYLPLFPIFIIILMLLTCNIDKKYIFYLLLIIIIAFLTDKYFIARIKFNQMQYVSSSSISSLTLDKYLFFNCDKDTILYNPHNYDATIMATGFRYCLPCRQMKTVLKAIARKFSNDDKVLLVEINPIDSYEDIKIHQSEDVWTLWIPIEPKRFEQKMHITSHPNLFIIDNNGKIKFAFSGYSPTMESSLIQTIIEQVEQIKNKYNKIWKNTIKTYYF